MYSRNPLPRFWPCSVDGHDRSPRSARERVGSQIPRQYGAAPFPAFCSFHQSDAFPPRYWRQNVIGGLYLAKLVSSSPQLRPWFTRSLPRVSFLVSFVTSWLAFLPLLAARPSPISLRTALRVFCKLALSVNVILSSLSTRAVWRLPQSV